MTKVRTKKAEKKSLKKRSPSEKSLFKESPKKEMHDEESPYKKSPSCRRRPYKTSFKEWFGQLDKFFVTFLKKMGHSRPLFLYFLYFRLFYCFIVQLEDKILKMAKLEPQVSGVGSDRSTN